MERLVGQSLSRYQLTKLLGQGGMGAVFKARDVTLQRDVAIKIMHPHMANQPDFRERFLQEARTAARLDHPSIVQVFDFGQERSLLFIVMKFIRGANLEDMLDELRAQGQWLPLDEAVQIIRHTAQAMHYAHQQGVLHRDLKPSNLMIEPEPSEGLPYRPVLTDLGLARLLSGQRLTQAGTSMGTPTYMSPEQALGEDTGPASDVYSLGVMLYELTVGQPPFSISSISEAIRYHTKEIPPPPSTVRADLPHALEHIILKALAKRPEERWEHAGALAEALGHFLGESEALPAATVVADGAPAVSLLTQYHRSVDEPRGASILDAFAAPTGTGDVIQARLRDGRTMEIEVRDRALTLGRGEDNDIVLDTPNVSRRHARIETDGTNYRVTDLDSTNGTYIGSAKLLPGVPETWTPEQPLHVGDVWMRLVRSGAQAATGRLGAEAPSGTVGMGGTGTRVDRSLLRSSGGEGRVGVVMQTTQLSVNPGERAVTSLTLLNQGSIVDHFNVAVDGIPAEWVTLPPIVQLMPGQQQDVTLTLHPPRSPSAQAGRYSMNVRVFSRDLPAQAVEVNASLTVAPYSQFTSSLHPQKIKAGKPTQVTIRNEGNFPETFTLRGADRANELVFEPPQAQVRVSQGESAAAEIIARPIKRRFIGGTKTQPFNVQIAPSQGAPQTHAGELVSRAVIPTWVPPLFLTLLLIACAALALVLTRAPTIELAEVVPASAEAGEPVTVRWRTTNARQVELRPFGVEVDAEVGEYTFTDGFPENTSVTLVASNMFRSSRESLNVQVVNIATDPVIVEWSVFPTEITLGQEVTIRWSVTNAESIRVQPFGTVDSSGERKDTPQQTQTYTLIADNQGRSVEQSERVVVGTPAPDAPEVTTFAVNPTTVVEGTAATIQLTWATDRADTVTIEPGLGPVGLAGSRDVPVPAADTIYSLVARGPGGEAQAQVQVYVQAQRCLVASGVHLRTGPGTVYDPPITTLTAGTEVKPIAYSPTGYPDGSWVKVQVTGTGEEGWVAQNLLSDCNINVTGLAAADIPPTPTPLPPTFEVTNVQVSVSPTSHTGVCPQPFNFTGQITVAGSGTVTYRWERSDGATADEETIDFAGPGTQAVNTSWNLGSDGSHWQRLRIIAPNEVVSNDASFTLTCLTKAVYIYRDNLALAQQYKQFLDGERFEVDIIAMGAIAGTDFTPYRLIFVGPDTGSGGTWGDNPGTQAQTIEDTNKPVVGLGQGGYAFFGKLGYPIGWGQGWSASGNSVYVMNTDHLAWNQPNEISVPGSRILQLYTSNSSFTAIHYPDPIAGVIGVGRQTNSDNHYPIIQKDTRYVLWGFDAGPQAMTPTGRQVFVNVSRSAMRLMILVPPIHIQPGPILPGP